MKVFCIGGAGFICSHIADRMIEKGHDVCIFDNMLTGREDNINPKSTHVIGDISEGMELGQVMGHFEPDVVVHAAASYTEPDNWIRDLATNAIGSANVVRCCEAFGVKRLIYFQTSLCYGKPRWEPITLDHPIDPETSYAISKVAGERYIAMGTTPYVVFRLAHIYGPRNLSGPIPKFFQNISLNKKSFASITRRDFVYIGDLVDIVEKAINLEGHDGIYHVSSGVDQSILKVFEEIRGIMGLYKAEVEVIPRNTDDVATILLDSRKTIDEFGVTPEIGMVYGLNEAIEWYKTHSFGETFTHLRGQK